MLLRRELKRQAILQIFEKLNRELNINEENRTVLAALKVILKKEQILYTPLSHIIKSRDLYIQPIKIVLNFKSCGKSHCAKIVQTSDITKNEVMKEQ